MIDAQEIEALEHVDAALMETAKELKPLYYAEPDNAVQEERDFLSLNGVKRNPLFTYKVLEYDTTKVEEELLRIQIPDTTLGGILEKNRKIALLENRVIANRGNSDVVRAVTIEIHGAPDERLVRYAERLLETLPTEVSVKNVPAYRIKQALEGSLGGYAIGWDVELTDKWLTSTDSSLEKITACKNRYFSEMDVTRLPIHEVGVHVLRAMNGFEQPLKMFGLSLPGYLPTEEGLTSYFEEVSGNTDVETQRSYAGRVLAVDSVCQNIDFRATYDRLRDHDFSEGDAWGLSLRAHRAGGYIKDHVYLQGAQRVKDFVEGGGDLRTLYVGKVGLDDLPLVGELLDEGFLKPAKYLPDFLDK